VPNPIIIELIYMADKYGGVLPLRKTAAAGALQFDIAKGAATCRRGLESDGHFCLFFRS